MSLARKVTAEPGKTAHTAELHPYALSLHLTDEQYRRLRSYVMDLEKLTGRRAAHQAILVAAMTEYLDQREPAIRGRA